MSFNNPFTVWTSSPKANASQHNIGVKVDLDVCSYQHCGTKFLSTCRFHDHRVYPPYVLPGQLQDTCTNPLLRNSSLPQRSKGRIVRAYLMETRSCCTTQFRPNGINNLAGLCNRL